MDHEGQRKFLTSSRRNEIAHRQEWKCAGPCKQLLPPTWCMDHIVPLRSGGSNELSNFQALCANCHALKTLKENQLYHERQRELKSQIKTFYVALTRVQEKKNEKPETIENNDDDDVEYTDKSRHQLRQQQFSKLELFRFKR